MGAHRPLRETLINYLYTLRRLAARLGGETRLPTATRAELEQFLADRLGEVSAATVSVECRALRSFFSWLTHLPARWRRAGPSPARRESLRSVAGWRSPAMVARYSRMNAEEIAHQEYRRLLG